VDQSCDWWVVCSRACGLVHTVIDCPRESVGTLGGILNFGSQLSAIAAPIATGYVAQAMHSFFWAFGAAAAFLLVGIAGYGFLLGWIETIPEPS